MEGFYLHPLVIRKCSDDNIVCMFVEKPASISNPQTVDCYIFNERYPSGYFTSAYYTDVMENSESLTDYECAHYQALIACQGYYTNIVSRRNQRMYSNFLKNIREHKARLKESINASNV